jgi:hypothetical protein
MMEASGPCNIKLEIIKMKTTTTKMTVNQKELLGMYRSGLSYTEIWTHTYLHRCNLDSFQTNNLIKQMYDSVCRHDILVSKFNRIIRQASKAFPIWKASANVIPLGENHETTPDRYREYFYYMNEQINKYGDRFSLELFQWFNSFENLEERFGNWSCHYFCEIGEVNFKMYASIFNRTLISKKILDRYFPCYYFTEFYLKSVMKKFIPWDTIIEDAFRLWAEPSVFMDSKCNKITFREVYVEMFIKEKSELIEKLKTLMNLEELQKCWNEFSQKQGEQNYAADNFVRTLKLDINKELHELLVDIISIDDFQVLH